MENICIVKSMLSLTIGSKNPHIRSDRFQPWCAFYCFRWHACVYRSFGLVYCEKQSKQFWSWNCILACRVLSQKPHLEQFSHAKGQLFQEILSRAPGWDVIGFLYVFSFCSLQNGADVILWVTDLLHLDLGMRHDECKTKWSGGVKKSSKQKADWKWQTYHSLQHNVTLTVLRGVHNSRAVNQENASH